MPAGYWLPHAAFVAATHRQNSFGSQRTPSTYRWHCMHVFLNVAFHNVYAVFQASSDNCHVLNFPAAGCPADIQAGAGFLGHRECHICGKRPAYHPRVGQQQPGTGSSCSSCSCHLLFNMIDGAAVQDSSTSQRQPAAHRVTACSAVHHATAHSATSAA